MPSNIMCTLNCYPVSLEFKGCLYNNIYLGTIEKSETNYKVYLYFFTEV